MFTKWIILAIAFECVISGSFMTPSPNDGSASIRIFHSNYQASRISHSTLSSLDCLLANLSINTSPFAMEYDSLNGEIYSADGYSVSVMNATSPTTLKAIYAGGSPQLLTWDSLNDLIYAANTLSGSISVIAGSNNTVIRDLPVPNLELQAVYLESQTGTLYISGSVPPSGVVGKLIAMNPATGAVTGQVTVGRSPAGIAVDTLSGDVFVSNAGSNNVSVVDGTTMRPIVSVPVSGVPYSEALDAQHGILYVNEISSRDIAEIDAATFSVTSEVPYASAFTSNGAEVLDTTSGQLFIASSYLQVLNTSKNSLVENLSLWPEPHALALDAKGSILFVTTESGDRMYEISLSGNCPGQRGSIESPYWEQPFLLVTLVALVLLTVIVAVWGWRRRKNARNAGPIIVTAHDETSPDNTIDVDV